MPRIYTKEFAEKIKIVRCKKLGKPVDDIQRFWSYVQIKDLFECWNWTGATTNGGYGVMNIRQKIIRATRISYELNIGTIPDGFDILHKCDNPSCVNPSHLFLGNDITNSKDKVNKSRQCRGKSRPQAKLTEQDVLDIRKMLFEGIVQAEIARRFGVGDTTIHFIKTNKAWKHIQLR